MLIATRSFVVEHLTYHEGHEMSDKVQDFLGEQVAELVQRGFVREVQADDEDAVGRKKKGK